MFLHLRTSTALGVMLAILLPLAPHASAEESLTLLFVPHCTEVSNCPEYSVADGLHFTTNLLAAGDILDIDVLVRGSKYASVRSVQSWIKYDPKFLEARSVELTAALPSPTPGEQSIDAVQGLVKIGGSTSRGFTSADTRIARVTFRVLDTSASTQLSFDGYNAAGNGNTAVNAERSTSDLDTGSLPAPPCIDAILGCRGSNTPLLTGEPAKLTVKLSSDVQGSVLTAQATGISSSSMTASSSSAISSAGMTLNDYTTLNNAQWSVASSDDNSSRSSSASSLSGQGSTFGILQVQDVRVTTKDTMIFLGWQPLKSSVLAGYNVYYGTVSGRYIQRRSLPNTSTSLVLRDLQEGTTYYLAVRAVDRQDQESVFSQEVSVTVGKPETATSPMTRLPPETGALTGNPIETRGGTTIEGETGSANIFILVMLVSGVIGTAFAFRRQFTLSHYGS